MCQLWQLCGVICSGALLSHFIFNKLFNERKKRKVLFEIAKGFIYCMRFLIIVRISLINKFTEF